jgi:serine/threonine-protein kinase
MRLPTEGAVIAGKYQIVRVVGEGGMGIVYEGLHVKMRQRVAIKMLLPETLGLPDVVARFEREARASGQLRSRHAARVMDVDQTPDGIPYMVMEFLEGQDLGTQIDTRGKIPVPEAVDYVLQACVAITEAHEAGIVHRDLKPSNLFLARDHDGVTVKLLDFGISKVTTEADRLTSAESVMGTPLYMSPEQVRSARNVDERADIWSIGVILYELVTGMTPFSGTTTQVAAAVVTDDVPPIMVEHGAPPALQDIVLRALQKDRTRRQASAREIAAALLPFADPSSTGARAVQALLAGGAASSGQFSQPSSGPMLNAATRISGPAQIVDATTGQDATVFNPPLDTPFAQNERPKTERTWTRGGDKKKPSPFILFGIVALGVACVVLVGVIALAKMRGLPLKGTNATSSSSQASATTRATPTATTTTTTTNTAGAGATPTDTASVASTASAPSTPSATPVATTPTPRPRGTGKPPTTNAGTTTTATTAAPVKTASPPATTATASPAIPTHL